MIFAKKKILVLCDDPPEDRVISIFAGCLANHDRSHSLRGLGIRMLTLDTNTSLYTEHRGLQVPMTLEHDKIVGTQFCDTLSYPS